MKCSKHVGRNKVTDGWRETKGWMGDIEMLKEEDVLMGWTGGRWVE